MSTSGVKSAPNHRSRRTATFTWLYLKSNRRLNAQDFEALCEATRRSDQGLRRGLVLPVAIREWSLTSLQQRLLKTGGRLIRHARYFTLQLADSYLTRALFGRFSSAS